MATRVTHITMEATDPELDRQYESALSEARERAPHVLRHHIGGEQRFEGSEFERVDPSNPGCTVARAPEATRSLVEAAVAAARDAQPGWRRLSVQERCDMLRSAQPNIAERRVQIAAAVSAETGKSRLSALAEVEEAIEIIDVYCREAETHNGYSVTERPLTPEETNETVLRPYGVFGVIAPFNFPVALSVNMTTAALVAGNTVVLKPAEDTPWSGSRAAEILAELLPPGVLNIVHGGPSTGEALVAAPVDGIAFTGSVEVGREILHRMHSGPYARPVVAEMGGSNPAIICESADVERAAEGVARAAFAMAGQMCSCCRRVLVAEPLYDEFLGRLIETAQAMVTADPSDARAFVGPLINARAVERHREGISLAQHDASVVLGGGEPELPGYFVDPTIVVDLPAGHPLLRDEYFSPIVAVSPTPSFEAALREANAVTYGLTAGLYTREPPEIERFLDEIEAGIVYVNRRSGATTGAWPGVQSYCGWKASGATGKGGLNRWYVPQFMREQSRTIALGPR